MAEVEFRQPPYRHAHDDVECDARHGIGEVQDLVALNPDADERPRRDADRDNYVHANGKAAERDWMDHNLDRAAVLPLLVKVQEARQLEDAPEPLEIRVVCEDEDAVARLDRPVERVDALSPLLVVRLMDACPQRVSNTGG